MPPPILYFYREIEKCKKIRRNKRWLNCFTQRKPPLWSKRINTILKYSDNTLCSTEINTNLCDQIPL